MRLIFEILVRLVLVSCWSWAGQTVQERKKTFKILKVIPIKKENKKAGKIIVFIILAAMILGVGMLVNNGTVVVKW